MYFDTRKTILYLVVSLIQVGKVPVIVCVMLLCFSKGWEGRLAKEGSLAPHTREKFRVIFKGVTTTLYEIFQSILDHSFIFLIIHELYTYVMHFI